MVEAVIPDKPEKKAYEYRASEANETAKQPQKGGKDGGNNLWQSILSEVVKRDDLEDSNLLLLGDRGNGKRSIVKEINSACVRGSNKMIPVNEMGSDYSALDFSFLYIKDLMD